jgi:hypothetical protein
MAILCNLRVQCLIKKYCRGGWNSAAKFNAPAIQALRLVGRCGYKTSSKKVPGELTIYKAVILLDAKRKADSGDLKRVEAWRNDERTGDVKLQDVLEERGKQYR